MRVTRSNILAPLSALALALVSPPGAALGTPAQKLLQPEAGGAGVALAQVTAWPAVSFAELLERTSPSHPRHAALRRLAAVMAPALAPAPSSAMTDGPAAPFGLLPLDDLLASPPMSVSDLLARAKAQVTGASAAVAAADGPARTPKKAAARAAAPLTVQVTIPDDPRALPQAKLTTTPAAIPSVAVAGPSGLALPLARDHRPGEARRDGRRVASVAVAPAPAKITGAASAGQPTAAAPLVLEIGGTPAGLTFKPESLTFPKAGGIALLRVAGKGLEGLSFFVRDAKIAELKSATGELHARQKGVTELYAVAQGRMYIVPVAVAEGANASDWDLKVPDALVSLEGVFQGSMKSALYPGLAQATGAIAAAGPGTGHAGTVATDAASLTAPSLQDSVAETTAALLRQAHEAERFYNAKEKLGYQSVTLQLVDDRTDVAAGRIYPVAGAQVHLVGTEFTAATDHTGHLVIRDMPQRSRFVLRIDDPSGAVRAAVAELATGDGESGIVRIRMMRSFAFEAYSTIAGVVPHAAYGSYCATVTDRSQSGRTQAGVSVGLDVQGQGPFYFNAYGFVDRSMTATGADGRFCFLNVVAGPAALSIYQDQAPVTTLPVSMYPGRHVDDDIDLGLEAPLATRLAAMPTAQELLSNDARLSGTYKTVDMIDLIPLGTTDPMMQVGPGQVATSDLLIPHHGRLRTYAQASEFEAAVYTYREGDRQSVTPLLPRGFIEDMSLYAQVTHDPALGSVLAEYATPAGVDREVIAMRLVDENGRDVGDGWYFSDDPVTKAVFFNVPAGTYSLLVETKDGYWLGADTVIVYNETVSYARLGSELRYRP